MYDYLIVGAGLFGSTFAYYAKKKGKKVLIVERRSHTGGNCYIEKIEGINVHKYGPHIFHTTNLKLWKFLNSMVKFNNFINTPLAIFKGEIFNLPFNMNTFNKLWGVVTPQEAQEIIERQKRKAGFKNPENLEEQAISLVGTDIYDKLIKGYTEKKWGRECKELPSFIIKRLPVRFKYDNNYYNDPYQGIPVGGYNILFDKLLKGIKVQLETDFLSSRVSLTKKAKKIIYTGMIDQYFDYSFGALEYRSLFFKNKILERDNYQGNAVINYTDKDVPYTRIIEHKHFEFKECKRTVITKEYPKSWLKGENAYYPINNEKNHKKYLQYKRLANQDKTVIFGGRLGDYQYYDMDKTIIAAKKLVKKELG